MTSPNGMTPEQTMAAMLSVLSNIQIALEAKSRIDGELVQKLDDLIGHFEVIDLTMEILLEMKDKQKLDIKDLARAWREAAEEIFGDEDEGDDDGGDQPVDAPDGPRVPSRIPG
jgi:hypothetical protein